MRRSKFIFAGFITAIMLGAVLMMTVSSSYASHPGAILIPGPLSAGNSLWPSVFEDEIWGAPQITSDESTMYLISAQRRATGEVCYVTGSGNSYRLASDLTTWVTLESEGVAIWLLNGANGIYNSGIPTFEVGIGTTEPTSLLTVAGTVELVDIGNGLGIKFPTGTQTEPYLGGTGNIGPTGPAGPQGATGPAGGGSTGPINATGVDYTNGLPTYPNVGVTLDYIMGRLNPYGAPSITAYNYTQVIQETGSTPPANMTLNWTISLGTNPTDTITGVSLSPGGAQGTGTSGSYTTATPGTPYTLTVDFTHYTTPEVAGPITPAVTFYLKKYWGCTSLESTDPGFDAEVNTWGTTSGQYGWASSASPYLVYKFLPHGQYMYYVYPTSMSAVSQILNGATPVNDWTVVTVTHSNYFGDPEQYYVYKNSAKLDGGVTGYTMTFN